MAVGARAERLRGSPKTITAPRHHCALHPPLPQPHQATPFPHARLIAPAVCADRRQRQPRRAQRGRRAAGARRAAHRRVRAPSPPAPALGRAQRLLLGRLDARHALRRRLPRAGGSSPTCSPALPRADLTRARCGRRAGPVRGLRSPPELAAQAQSRPRVASATGAFRLPPTAALSASRRPEMEEKRPAGWLFQLRFATRLGGGYAFVSTIHPLNRL